MPLGGALTLATSAGGAGAAGGAGGAGGLLSSLPNITGSGMALVGSIGNIFAGRKSTKELMNLMKQTPVYQQNPLAQQRLGLAQQLFNARMPGAAAAERNIATSAAGTMANASRAASSGAQLLAMGGASQGQVGEAYNQLAQQEAANRQQQYQNLVGAQEGVINEADKAYQDKIRRFQDQVQAQGVKAQNRANMWTSIGNLGGQMASSGTGSGNGMASSFPQMGSLSLPSNIQPLSSQSFRNNTSLPTISSSGLSLPPGVGR